MLMRVELFFLIFFRFGLRAGSLTDVINSNRSRGEGLVGTTVRLSQASLVF